MKTLDVYCEKRDLKLQSMRLGACIGLSFSSSLFGGKSLHTILNPYTELQTELLTLFTVTSFVFALGAVVSLLGFFVNRKNKDPLSEDEILEVDFYACEDADIALFTHEIRKENNRDPVFDEYCQILAFAHERRLRIYHEVARSKA